MRGVVWTTTVLVRLRPVRAPAASACCAGDSGFYFGMWPDTITATRGGVDGGTGANKMTLLLSLFGACLRVSVQCVDSMFSRHYHVTHGA